MAVDMNTQGLNRATTVKNKVTATPKADEKKPVSKAVIGGALVGLAALASVGIYLATKGKGKCNVKQDMVDELNNQANTDKLKELQNQVYKLKNKILKEYFELLDEQKGFKGNICPTTRDAYKKLSKNKQEMQELLDTNEPLAKEYSTKVRNTVKNLQNDPEYIELIKLRNQYRKEVRNCKWENGRKLVLVEELIYTKLNGGQKTPYFKKLGFEQKEAFEMLSLPAEQLEESIYKNIPQIERSELVGCDRAGSVANYMYLKNIFKNGKEGMEALYNVKRARKYLDGKVAETTAQRIKEARVNVANEIRQSDDVKALKELNKQIAELSKQTSK